MREKEIEQLLNKREALEKIQYYAMPEFLTVKKVTVKGDKAYIEAELNDVDIAVADDVAKIIKHPVPVDVLLKLIN